MSVSLILQDENRKILGGYLWLFLNVASALALYNIPLNSSTTTSLNSFVSFYVVIASFPTLACITIRPETWFNSKLIGKSEIPPYFNEKIEDLPISSTLNTPFLSKEKDNFYGNAIVAMGFFFAIFLPLQNMIDHELAYILNWVKLFLCAGVFLYILIDLFFRKENQRKSLRNNAEIVWRFLSLISQPGWDESAYKRQIDELENSIKLRIWSKARYQLEGINNLYVDYADIFRKEWMNKLHHAFFFYSGKVVRDSSVPSLDRNSLDRNSFNDSLKRFRILMNRNGVITKTKPVQYELEDFFPSEQRKLLQWYLEDYLGFPFGPERKKGERIAKLIPIWGEKLFTRVFGNSEPNSESTPSILYQQALEKGFVNCQLCIRSNNPEFLSLPWEIIRDPDYGGKFLALTLGGFFRQLTSLEIPTIAKESGDSVFRILYRRIE